MNLLKNALQPTRLLHIMLRVNHLETSINFYTQHMGMRLLRQNDYSQGRFTLAFLGFADEAEATVIELTHNWDTASYQMGNALGHLAFAVRDIYACCENFKAQGIKITRAPAAMRYDSTETIAFIEDPDGYTIELIEKAR